MTCLPSSENTNRAPQRQSSPTKASETRFSKSSESLTVNRLCFCCPAENELQHRQDSTQIQRTTAVRYVGTLFEPHRDHQPEAYTVAQPARSHHGERGHDKLPGKYSGLSKNVRVPIDRWLAEGREEEPFHTIDGTAFVDFVLVDGAGDSIFSSSWDPTLGTKE